MLMIDEAGRTVLPTVQFGFYALTPIFLLFCLSITPVHVIPTRVKQIFSLPLLTSLLYVPCKFCDTENGNKIDACFTYF